LVERATIEFPPVMLDAEVDRLFHDQAGHLERGEQLEQYLANIGKTEEEVRAELRPIADMRLRRSLVLSEVAEVEHIEATPDEVDAEIERLVASAGPQGAQLRQFMSSDDGRSTIRRNLATKKTLARLVEIATRDGVAEPTAEVEAPKKKKSRSRASAKVAALPAETGAAEEE
jgi:trigger factor